MELLFTLLVILLAAGAGYYFLVRWGRGKVQNDARLLSGELRSFENQYRQALAELQEYSPGDPEPYGALVGRLYMDTDQIGQELYILRGRYVHIQQGLPRKAANPLQTLAFSPFKLLDLNSEIGDIHKGLETQQTALVQAAQQAQSLDRLAWGEALQIRQAATTEEDLEQRARRLSERHAHGSAFDALAGMLIRVHGIIAQVPDSFFNGDQEAVKALDKAEVIALHTALESSRPLLEQGEAQLAAWEKDLASLDERLVRLRSGMDNLGVTLQSLPAPLDSAGLQTRYAGSQAEWQRLEGQAARPDLEKIPVIESAIDQQLQILEELETTARQARQGQAALEHILAELAQAQQALSDQYAALGTAKSYRVVWSKTSSTLAALSQQINELGSAQRKRTPEKLEADLEKANQLSLAQKELGVYLEQIGEQHGELAVLLEGSELSQALLWVQNSDKLIVKIHAFHGDNWPRADGTAGLPEDLHSLADGLQRLGASRPAEGIPEDQLPKRLTEAQRLGGLYQALRVRVNAVEARLAELQQSEVQTRDILDDTRKNLAQIGFIVNSNPFLTKIAAGEIGRFQKQIEKQLAELEQRQQGTVDSKARQAQGLAVRIETAANGWLEQLNQDTQQKVKALTASLTRLDSIAPLDDAPAAEARRLLTGGHPYGSAYGQKPQFPLQSLVLEFKKRSEYSQNCTAVQQALGDLEKPVVESYTTASQNRQQVQDQFNAANQWARQARAWPPVAVDVDPEYQALGRLEAEWAALREKPIKAIDLVKRLGDLAREYQGLAGRLSGLIERGNREQKDVQKLEDELDEDLRKWEKLLASYQDSVEANEEIRQLLSEADQEMYRVKTEYHDGKLAYEQALKAIQQLQRKVRLYQAVLDETHVVDVSGRVIASRESKRAPGEW